MAAPELGARERRSASDRRTKGGILRSWLGRRPALPIFIAIAGVSHLALHLVVGGGGGDCAPLLCSAPQRDESRAPSGPDRYERVAAHDEPEPRSNCGSVHCREHCRRVADQQCRIERGSRRAAHWCTEPRRASRARAVSSEGVVRVGREQIRLGQAQVHERAVDVRGARSVWIRARDL
jgi:hypothetical protein